VARKANGHLGTGAGANDGTHSQSFIDASLTIMGDLYSEGDVQLDGRVCGNVSCAQLIVGKDAAITGAVTAQQTVIRGSVTGTIRSPVVILQDTARVDSEITYSVLAVDDGAMFQGAARRSERPLEESATVSPLEELQRITHAGEPANGNGANGASPQRGGVRSDAEGGAPAGRDPEVDHETDVQRRSSHI
jgi:cytoskeletal protein CcmA (bactofilin family)